MKHVLLAVSGPSGVGKGTMVKTLIARREDVVESVSCTTRAPREGDFLEYDEHFGNYYGTPKSFVRETLPHKSIIMEIDVVGALNAKKEFPETVLVMVVPPSVEELRRRLSGRGSETEAQIQNRLERMEYELSHADEYDYVVVNDDLEKAIRALEDIIDKA